MTILGISCYFHDAAACILVDGEVKAAAAEERFSRIKHDNDFPYRAIEYCLNELGLAMNEVDVVAFYEKPILKFERVIHQHLQHFPKSLGTFLRYGEGWFNQKLNIKKVLQDKLHYYGEVYFTEHHAAHAASVYFPSPFEDAAIVTIDGVGEWATTTTGVAKDTKILLQKQINFPNSLGLLYSALTTYLGFSANDAEYKVMGLAAYGDPKPFRKQFSKLILSNPDGSYSLTMKYFSFEYSPQMFSAELPKLFGLPPRMPESEVGQSYADIAAALQETLESVVFKLLRAVHKRTGSNNLCLAGGVALNSVMNGKILSNTPFTRLFIPPDPSDAGGATGAALAVHYTKKTTSKKISSTKTQRFPISPYLGPSYYSFQIEKALRAHKLDYTFVKDKKSFVSEVADLLTQNKVIGWFQGRMEWGPRALGNRSILAAAVDENMKDVINERVKHRELFRPFAPAILEEHVSDFFVTDASLSPSTKWMLLVYPFKKNMRKKLPAVVHVDGTGRLQTIAKQDNALFHELISTYYKKTGIPSIINTSFNVRGEPIVCTPEDAIRCFLQTDIDILVMNRYIVRKK